MVNPVEPTPTAEPSVVPLPSVSAPVGNPFMDRGLYIRPDSKAAEAAEFLTGRDQQIVARIAATPTAIWLTPEELPSETIADFVADEIAAAGTTVPTFVVYGIPERDCTGGHSSGGLDATSYPAWLDQIAGALMNYPTIILEPDALATAEGCNLTAEREEYISTALNKFAGKASVYVDAGHSNWVAPEAMAAMLQRVGIERARGFAVNVSAYGTENEERAYAEAIRAVVPTAHYVIDSSRNGAGSNGDWCNANDRALGATPGVVTDGSSFDARLWIKPPGESDGTCNGGPNAGVFWAERAVEMAQAAGW